MRKRIDKDRQIYKKAFWNLSLIFFNNWKLL